MHLNKLAYDLRNRERGFPFWCRKNTAKRRRRHECVRTLVLRCFCGNALSCHNFAFTFARNRPQNNMRKVHLKSMHAKANTQVKSTHVPCAETQQVYWQGFSAWVLLMFNDYVPSKSPGCLKLFKQARYCLLLDSNRSLIIARYGFQFREVFACLHSREVFAYLHSRAYRFNPTMISCFNGNSLRHRCLIKPGWLIPWNQNFNFRGKP